MAYIKFEKEKLINLSFSLDHEQIRSNRAGSYASFTLVGCNTRKYHGLLICPLDEFNGEKHVLLSGLDETIVQHDSLFNFGIHQYKGEFYDPNGHKYIREFVIDKIPKFTYRVGGVVLTKESILVEKEEQILIKYTLEEAHSPTKIRFKPFLAFRNIHALSKANMHANTKYQVIENGIKSKLYAGYPFLHMQFSKAVEFLSMPDWYYDIEYYKEKLRGYDYLEDLFVPGYFEMDIKKGESIIFSASTKETNVQTLVKKFDSELAKRFTLDSYKTCLLNASNQFIVKKDKKTEIIAGFPWFGSWGRDTFISLPGLTLPKDDEKTFVEVMDTMVKKMKNGLFPNVEGATESAFNSVDAPMWFFWALQQYVQYIDNSVEIWKKYGKTIKDIINGFEKGLAYNIRLHDNGLIYAGEVGKALTWMDAVVYGKPVTPRMGYAVEINALWYNAIQFSLEMASQSGDKQFVSKYSSLPEKIKESFISTFWDEKKAYLADCVDGNNKDWSVRPNQVFATHLTYSPLTNEMKKAVLDLVKEELLTPRGLRTLSPNDERYIGIYHGSQEERDHAYHQGTVWPWLLGAFCEGYLKIHKKSGVNFISDLINGFEEAITEHGLGSISEIYDGNPPHSPRGAISQAWSVAEILRVMKLIEQYK